MAATATKHGSGQVEAEAPQPFHNPTPLRHFKAGTDDLRKAVKAVSSFWKPERRLIPANFCLLSAEDGIATAEFRGCDCTAAASFLEEGGASGWVLLPFTTLAAFLDAATDETVTIEHDAEAGRYKLRSGRLEANVIPLAGEPFPAREIEAPPIGPDAPLALAEGVLAWLLDLTAPCVSSEETRYYLNGVCFDITGSTLGATATNGHKLGRRERKASGDHHDVVAAIVPRDVVAPLHKAARGREAMVRLRATTAAFQIGDLRVTCKLIDGTFPDWRKVIPSEAATPHRITIEGADLRLFFKAVRGFTKERGRPLKLSARNGVPAIELESPEVGTVRLPCTGTVAGTPERIGMNSRYLQGLLAALGAKRLRIDLGHPGSPMRVTDDASPDTGYAILMPTRI